MECAHTSHFGHGQKKVWLSWVHFCFLYSPEGGLGSHMVHLGYKDTDWIDGRKRDVLDDFTTEWERTGHFGHGQKKMWLSWVHFWLVWVPEGGP